MPSTSAGARGATARVLTTASDQNGERAKSVDTPRSCTTRTSIGTSSTPYRKRAKDGTVSQTPPGGKDAFVALLLLFCFCFYFTFGIFYLCYAPGAFNFDFDKTGRWSTSRSMFFRRPCVFYSEGTNTFSCKFN